MPAAGRTATTLGTTTRRGTGRFGGEKGARSSPPFRGRPSGGPSGKPSPDQGLSFSGGGDGNDGNDDVEDTLMTGRVVPRTAAAEPVEARNPTCTFAREFAAENATGDGSGDA